MNLQQRTILTFSVVIAWMTLLSACSKKEAVNELWIYTSLYEDTITDLTPRLKNAFPGVKFQWFQAGSEEIATKVNAEILATGKTKADVLISSDRFWYEELAKKGFLLSYQSENAKSVHESLRNKDGFYTAVSVPVMVLSYNSDAVSAQDAPKTFKEMTEGRWKDKFSTGSPLASGTNFTTMAVLQNAYGWEYIEGLRKNNTLSEGGNSAVIRRIQSKERPVGWVLLENLLRFQGKDQRLKVIYPEDGVVIQANVMAIVKKENDSALAKKFVDYMYGQEGQEAMIRSYMYSPLENFPPPTGALPYTDLAKRAFLWSQPFIDQTVDKRDEIKEKIAHIMFE